jgi:DMSO/TMAO reductase YedYZ heme-binding membrane subunit
MNWKDLLQTALVLVVAFVFHLYLGAIGVTLDPTLFNTIVAATVVWLLSKFGVEVARARGVRGIK